MKHYSNKPLPSSSSMCPPGDGHLHPNPFESAPSGQVDTSQAGHLSFSNSLVGHWKALKNWKKNSKKHWTTYISWIFLNPVFLNLWHVRSPTPGLLTSLDFQGQDDGANQQSQVGGWTKNLRTFRDIHNAANLTFQWNGNGSRWSSPKSLIFWTFTDPQIGWIASAPWFNAENSWRSLSH